SHAAERPRRRLPIPSASDWIDAGGGAARAGPVRGGRPRRHGRAPRTILASSPRAEVVLCVDSDPARRDACVEGAQFVEELEPALDAVSLDAVVVATPQAQHREVAEAALARGLAVLCEMPIAGTLADADAMIAVAEAAGALLAIGHVCRF